jgi:hypothetical protein
MFDEAWKKVKSYCSDKGPELGTLLLSLALERSFGAGWVYQLVPVSEDQRPWCLVVALIGLFLGTSAVHVLWRSHSQNPSLLRWQIGLWCMPPISLILLRVADYAWKPATVHGVLSGLIYWIAVPLAYGLMCGSLCAAILLTYYRAYK